MFCYQCEQTAKGEGCTVHGVCGKDPRTAAMQDLLVHVCKGISMYASRAGRLGKVDKDIDAFILEALFSTITNVNFDYQTVADLVRKGLQLRDRAREVYERACKDAGKRPENLEGPASWSPPTDNEGLLAEAESISVKKRILERGADVAGLEELVTYGLKGAAAYADHAMILGVEDEELYGAFSEVLDYLAEEHSPNELVEMALRVGEINLRAMELLDRANTKAFGDPQPTRVRITPVKGKAIVVSGHDLKDLGELLRQTEGKGINVYTHGEMLPCHGYPGLNRFDHLVGNYGGAWQDQQREFDEFPGAILMTTNCIQKPRDSYRERIFTTGLVQWPGVRHVSDGDFSPVIAAALKADGFEEDGPERYITVGFGHGTVLGVADKLVDMVERGTVRHFFLIGGCDGAKSGRNYYTELSQAVPDDCLILTLACGKYRFNKLEFGEVDGIPRLLDVGQCNDAYSAIRIASALAEAFEVDVNDLPLSLVLSWYEQKAVAILLTLFHLGVRDIRLGPSLPACLTPSTLNVLVREFDVKPISTPEEDIAAILGA
ncbi:hydroxylamine reductase [Candidatus Fermentibacteria bacterium]|nr:hydroxylamine reductase [Candidatus Fermentibacteria bacterium]